MAVDERRKSTRTVSDSYLQYSFSTLDDRNMRRVQSDGQISDISDTGLGFFTDSRLEPGHILMLRIEEDNTPYAAVVRWVRKSSGRYRVGASLCK